MININIGGPQASVSLNARRTLDGNLLILDHDQIDIIVYPSGNKVISFPKDSSIDDTYYVQNKLFEYLWSRGIVDRESVRSGNIFNSLEGIILESQQVNSVQAAVYSIAEFLTEEAEQRAASDQYRKDVESYYFKPADQDSTELGEVPQQSEKGAMRPGYYYIPLRYRY